MSKDLNKPILYIFSGLPCTGKSTMAKMLASYLKASYIRIDTVEQGLRDFCYFNVQGEGYRLSYKIASDNLNLGINTIVDSCNPISLTRNEWIEVAKKANANFINIEVTCSNKNVHRKRVEERTSIIKNLKLPTWEEVQKRKYDEWCDEKRVVVDTANVSIDESFRELNYCLSNYIFAKPQRN